MSAMTLLLSSILLAKPRQKVEAFYNFYSKNAQ
jgi:hypothetical protein